MEEFVCLNASKLPEVMMKLQAVECKMMLLILYYLSQQGQQYFINNEKSREFMASVGFSKTPERISAILSAMVKKGVINREAQGVYSVSKDLYVLKECNAI